MVIKLLFGHFAISLSSIAILAIVVNILNDFCDKTIDCESIQMDLFWVVLLLLFLAIYFLNGYVTTTKIEKWYNYFPVAVIGIIFWLICFIIAPNSTDYKSGDGDIWFLYEFYIVVKSPINFLADFQQKYSLSFDLFQKFIFPIIFSVCQFAGGKLKYKKINNSNAS